MHGADQRGARLLPRARGAVLQHEGALRRVRVLAAAAMGAPEKFSRLDGLLRARALAPWRRPPGMFPLSYASLDLGR